MHLPEGSVSGRPERQHQTMREKTYRTAFGGIISALALTFLFLGSVFPFADIAGPAFASLCVLLTGLEFSGRFSLGVYASVSVLAFMLVPDKESVLLFIFFFGWFPILKKAADSRMRLLPGLLVKLAAFNLSIVLMYWLILKVFVIESIADEFSDYSTAMYFLIMILANITVIILDYAFSKVAYLYLNIWRKKLIR